MDKSESGRRDPPLGIEIDIKEVQSTTQSVRSHRIAVMSKQSHRSSRENQSGVALKDTLKEIKSYGPGNSQESADYGQLKIMS